MSVDRWSWEVFIGCMFIGMGIGMVFDHSGAGTLIGMGVGFILSSMIRISRADKRPLFRLRVSSPFISLVGVFFILLGLRNLGILYLSEKNLNLLWGISFILLGIIFILGSIRILIKR